MPRVRVTSVLSGAMACMLGTAACAASGPGAAPAPALAEWSVPACLVEDAGAPIDTLRVTGARLAGVEALAMRACGDARAHARAERAPVIVELDIPAGTDRRDVLEPGLPSTGMRPDVLVTHDPLLLAFAGSRGGYLATPLPWTRTYVLVSSAAHPLFTISAPADREALARDAVSASARGAREPFPWLTDAACAGPVTASAVRPRDAIAYVAGDATGRELAERIVALAGAMRVMALAADSITPALATGRAAAAVIAVPRDPRPRCTTPGAVRVPLNAVPLVDARDHVLVRRGSGAAFLVAPDGSLRFISPSRR